MTDAEWQASSDPVTMVDAVQLVAEPALLRLLGCRCCRLIWEVLRDQRSRAAVEVAERHAAGAASASELHAAWRLAEDAVNAAEEAAASDADGVFCLAASAARAAAFDEEWGAPGLWAVEQALRALEREGRGREEWLRRALCELARSMFPPPSQWPAGSPDAEPGAAADPAS